MNIKNLICFGIFLCLFSNCRKDEVVIEDPMLIDTEAPILLEGYTPPPFQAVTASVFGQIFNENNDPLEGVRIIVEDHVTVTDENGLFSLGEINLNTEGSLIKASYDGYIRGSRTIYPQEGSTSRIKINLIPKILTESFNSEEGAVVQVEGGASIVFEPNGIVYAGGGAYSGEVKVYAKVLDPTNTMTMTEMPGDLSAIRPTDSYSETGLISYGMLLVELYSSDDRKLQLAENFPAQISIPVPESLKEKAESTIPLWYFNENVAKWVEEGEAILENGVYTGSVTHFSFWNCDMPNDFTTICLTFKNASNRPIVGMEVFVKSETSGIRSEITDANGFVSGFVPADSNLSICTGALVNGATWSTDIGSISMKTDLTYTLDFTEILGIDPQFSVISGHLTCEGVDVENALMRVETNQETYFYEIDEQSFFMFFYHNDGEVFEKIQITDLSNQNSTQEILLFNDFGTVSVNDYEMCPQAEEYLYFNLTNTVQFSTLDNIEMSVVDFVSPSVIQIRATTDINYGVENLFTMDIHGAEGAGDYSGEMTHDGRTFAKANMALGYEGITSYRGSPLSIELTSFDVNGFIEGEFSGQLFTDALNGTVQRTVFGRFRVKYEAPTLDDSSFLDVVINGERQVDTGLTGRVSGNSFRTDSISLHPTLNIEFDGTTAGNYASQNYVAQFWNLFNFDLPLTVMDEFEVTQFDDVGGYVKGNFKGVSTNSNYIDDNTEYPIDGIFSILNQ